MIKQDMPSIEDFFRGVFSRLNRVEPHRTDAEIDEVLVIAAQHPDIDEIYLVLFGETGEVSVVKQYASASGPLTHSPQRFGDGCIPWTLKRLQNGETVFLTRLPDDLPAYAKRDRVFFTKEGINTALSVPLATSAVSMGGLSVFSRSHHMPFTKSLVDDIVFLAEMLATVLSRKKAAQKMDETLAYEHLLSDISARYINLPIDEVEKVMSMDLGRLARVIDAERCILYLAEDDGETFRPYLHSGWWLEEDKERIIKNNELWERHDPEFIKDFRYLFYRWRKGDYVQWTQADRLPPEGRKMQEAYQRFGCMSQLSVPVSVSGSTVAVLTVSDNHSCKTWPAELVPRLRLFGEVFANALARKESEEALQKAFVEVKQLKERFEADYIYLRNSLDSQNDFTGIIGKSDALKQILTRVSQVAPTDVTVLLLGETGTGKGLIARTLHNQSKRRDRPLMQVNCAALSAGLIESELFGHEKGAFTGATVRRIGRFESARGTTIFLDEVGELPLELQAKLLRVLQDGEFERVGGSMTLKTDVRIIAATNRKLEEEVRAGRFRKDLWYRLNVFPISIPSLRQRLEDIPLFVEYFLEKYGKWIGKKFDRVPQQTIHALERYDWPGNIRELENLIERAVITSPDGNIQIEVPSTRIRPGSGLDQTLEAFEREYITSVLIDKGWQVKGLSGAAKHLGLNPSTLRTRMDKLGIRRPR
jgi:formate hydrogenlyase transcriptional activator